MDKTAIEKMEPHPVFKYYAQGFVGNDKFGHPMIFLPYGNMDIKGLIKSMRCSEFLQLCLFSLDYRWRTAAANSKKFGHPVEQAIYIVDLKGFGTKNLWLQGLDTFQEVFQAIKSI